MRLSITRFKTSLAALAVITVAACSNGVGPDIRTRASSPGVAETALTNGLVHRLSLPRSPESGSDITIRSVLVNTSATSILVEHRECGLDYSGTLKLSGPPHVLKCQAHSSRRQLAAGDSIVGGDYMRVASGPGRYELRVRHALDPQTWTSIAVVVR
jgi:hypothetical protein